MVDLETIQYMTRKEADMSFKMRVRTIFEYIEPSDDMRVLDLPCAAVFISICFAMSADASLSALIWTGG